MSESKIEQWALEYELRQLIDIAIRYSIEGVYSTVNEKNPYSIIFSDLTKLRYCFELFCTQLRQKLIESENWKAIEIDLNDRFLAGIDLYLKWYDSNKEKTNLFGAYNPYEIIYNISLSAKKEISKYFIDNQESPKKSNQYQLMQPFRDEKSRKLFLFIVDNWDYKANTKWGYIWSYFVDRGAGKLTTKTEYEAYIRQSVDLFKGKPNYHACNDEKRYQQLEELKEQFDRVGN
jgi:hypothetical protein